MRDKEPVGRKRHQEPVGVGRTRTPHPPHKQGTLIISHSDSDNPSFHSLLLLFFFFIFFNKKGLDSSQVLR